MFIFAASAFLPTLQNHLAGVHAIWQDFGADCTFLIFEVEEFEKVRKAGAAVFLYARRRVMNQKHINIWHA